MNESNKNNSFGSFIVIIIIVLLLYSCGASESSGKRRCKICGKEYDFNWIDLCPGCKSLSEKGWFD